LTIYKWTQAWDAICDLLGGAERIDGAAGSSTWGDSFIVNLGAPQYENDDVIDPRDLGNWHVDGDFFVSEQSSVFFRPG
jgi:hypothetical protein